MGKRKVPVHTFTPTSCCLVISIDSNENVNLCVHETCLRRLEERCSQKSVNKRLDGCHSRSVPRPAAVFPTLPAGFEDRTFLVPFHPTHVLWEKNQVKQLAR